MPSESSKTPITVIGAIIANFIISVAKFVAAVFTGSSSMLSEGIHSLADTGNEALLLLGVNLSKRPADETHPFGHGKELYFWSIIVAMILFGLGGGLSIYEGITHIQHPETLRDPIWNYVVLGIAMLAEGTSLGIAINEFFKQEKKPQEDPNVKSISDILTMHFGPKQVLLAMDVRFEDKLSGDEIADAMDSLEGKIRKKHPEVDRIFIEAESVRDMRKAKGTNVQQ